MLYIYKYIYTYINKHSLIIWWYILSPLVCVCGESGDSHSWYVPSCVPQEEPEGALPPGRLISVLPGGADHAYGGNAIPKVPQCLRIVFMISEFVPSAICSKTGHFLQDRSQIWQTCRSTGWHVCLPALWLLCCQWHVSSLHGHLWDGLHCMGVW